MRKQDNKVKDRKIRLEQLELDKEARLLKASQRGKSNIEILEDLDRRETEELYEGAIEVSEMFGISGVYFLFRDKKLVYIGESECILSRLSQHFKEKIKEFDSYKVFKLISNIEERKKEEARLIKKFRPVLNFTHNRNMNKI